MTTLEIVLTLGAGCRDRGGACSRRRGRAAYGLWPLGLLLAFTALTGAVGRLVGAARRELAGRRAGCSPTAACSRRRSRSRASLPARWRAVLGGIDARGGGRVRLRAADEGVPRLARRERTSTRACEQPYGYWNAIGLTAAMGAIGCMWLGARRAGHALLSALAYPAMGLMLLTLMLAYSRGALAALAIGAGCCGSASCRCACAARAVLIVRRARRRRGGRLGLLQARAQHRQRRARRARHRRPPARGAAARDAARCSTLVGVAIGFFTRPPRAVAAARGAARAPCCCGAARRRADRLRGRARAQPPRASRAASPTTSHSLTNPNAQVAAEHARAA